VPVGAREATISPAKHDGRLEAGAASCSATPTPGQARSEIQREGALNSIAGVLNEKLNVLGLMPHPGKPCGIICRLYRRARAVPPALWRISRKAGLIRRLNPYQTAVDYDE